MISQLYQNSENSITNVIKSIYFWGICIKLKNRAFGTDQKKIIMNQSHNLVVQISQKSHLSFWYWKSLIKCFWFWPLLNVCCSFLSKLEYWGGRNFQLNFCHIGICLWANLFSLNQGADIAVQATVIETIVHYHITL